LIEFLFKFQVKSSNVINGELFNVDVSADELDEIESDPTNHRWQSHGHPQDFFSGGKLGVRGQKSPVESRDGAPLTTNFQNNA